MSELPAHSPLGASGGKRWINCGGSVLATRDLPDVDSEFALEGTAAHKISEIARCENKPMSHYLGTQVGVNRLDGTIQHFTVNQEMVDAVQEFIDHCELLPGDAFFEVRVHYDSWVPNGFGTSDDIRIDNEVCNITDLKYGKGEEVEAENNVQNMLYALGVYHDFGWMYDIKQFNLHIAQTRVGPIKSFSISTEDLLKWADEVVRPAAKRALEPDAPFKAGDWCRWCKIGGAKGPNQGKCKVRANYMANEILQDFDEVDTTDLSKKENQIVKPVALMTNDQVAKVGHILDNAKAWIKDIESYMMRSLQQGIKIGDWKLVAGRSNRKWDGEDKDVEVVIYSLMDATGKQLVVEDQLYKKKIKGPAEVEKIIGKKHPLMRLSSDKEEPGIVRKPPGKPKLAPGSDPRPPIAERDLKELMDDFEEIEEDDE